jgi:transposase
MATADDGTRAGSSAEDAALPRAVGRPRYRKLDRTQLRFQGESLNQLLPPDHPTRLLWSMVSEWDLSKFEAVIEAVAGRPGAPAFDPRVLLTLWIQAILDGYGSARELADLCRTHLVYRWICGDEPVNHHTLADFRSLRGAAIDELLTQTIATACAAGIASLEHVAQDGMKVRAGAGQSSFRRAETLAEHLIQAQTRVESLKSQVDEDGGAVSRKAAAARQRAAADRVERLTRAKAALDQLVAANAKRAEDSRTQAASVDPAKLRASETDPEARRMMFADGGIRAAFNVQFATTTQGGVIVGVTATNQATDHAQSEPMVEQIRQRTGRRPGKLSLDGGFVSREVIERLGQAEVLVYAPVKEAEKTKETGRDPYAPRPRDTSKVGEWRVRMGTDEGKATYKLRSQTAEWVNAHCRNRGLQQLRLRGTAKVTTEVTWFALAHNIDRLLAAKRTATTTDPLPPTP